MTINHQLFNAQFWDVPELLIIPFRNVNTISNVLYNTVPLRISFNLLSLINCVFCVVSFWLREIFFLLFTMLGDQTYLPDSIMVETDGIDFSFVFHPRSRNRHRRLFRKCGRWLIIAPKRGGSLELTRKYVRNFLLSQNQTPLNF